MIYYPTPLTKQPALRKYSDKADCRIAEESSKKVLSVPVHPSLTEEDLHKILEAIEKVSIHYSR
jgi:dTDP-4-amino-4,6-dideoxygalactose transaminase